MPNHKAIVDKIALKIIGIINSQLLSISAICVSDDIYKHIKKTRARNIVSGNPLQFMGFELISCYKLPRNGFAIICEGV